VVSKFRLGDNVAAIERKESISRTLEIGNNYAGELSIEVLPLEKVELDPDNKRDMILTLEDAINGINKDDPQLEKKKQDWKSLESLANTIKQNQIINPIFVYRYGNKCRLIAGERRTLASAIAGKKEVLARIATQRPVGTKLRVLQWIENNERSDLSLSERISSLEAILQEHFLENKESFSKKKITAQLLSDLSGISPSQARRYILILNAEKNIRDAISEGKLENIKLAELICSVDNLENQTKLLNAALAGQSFDSITKLKKTFEVFSVKKIDKRARKKSKVSLGKVKPNFVKIIVEALSSCSHFDSTIAKQILHIKNEIEWEKNESVENSFRKLINLFEGKGSY
jgi:ParB family chromosome partitioning protein